MNIFARYLIALVRSEPTLFEFKDRGDGFESITFSPHSYLIPCILYCQRCKKIVQTEESTLHGESHDKITNKNLISLYYFNFIETQAEHDAFVTLVKKVSAELTIQSFLNLYH